MTSLLPLAAPASRRLLFGLLVAVLTPMLCAVLTEVWGVFGYQLSGGGALWLTLLGGGTGVLALAFLAAHLIDLRKAGRRPGLLAMLPAVLLVASLLALGVHAGLASASLFCRTGTCAGWQ
ncbi:hypothetical protein [Eleftheria terrae]|uniref:hypothetical protein n=1 Tax=Eleftheria terrae TaxID=1597781 RepID=UPI00263A8B92|nr:hypothetical protein [Eleftheria terrae]WKB55381.1 hypothetical protein N7L95_25195 [Eleftheria terrae]